LMKLSGMCEFLFSLEELSSQVKPHLQLRQ